MTKGLKIALAATAAFVVAIGVEALYLHHRNMWTSTRQWLVRRSTRRER